MISVLLHCSTVSSFSSSHLVAMSRRFKEVSTLKGKVEFVDYVSSTIRLETTEIVCWALCYENDGIFVPNVGDVITIMNLHLDTLSYPKEYYIHAEGAILLSPTAVRQRDGAPPSPTYMQSELSTLVHRHNLKLAHLWSYHKLYPNINLKGICVDRVDAIKLCLLSKLLEHCGTFKIIKVVTVQDLQYAAMEGSNYEFQNYINSFRCGELNEYLIGLLRINKNGTYELTDGDRVLPCLIDSPDDEPKKKFDNEIVVMIRYFVLGEVYVQPPARVTYEYLHAAQSDIVQLKLTSSMEPNLFHFLSATAPSRFTDKITFKLRNVSLPMSDEDKSTNFWMEIEKENGDGLRCLLCFGWEYSMTLALLQIGSIYDLYLKVKLKPYHDVELNRVCKQSFKVFSSSAVFVKVRTDRITYLTVEEVWQRLTDLNSNGAHRNSKIYVNFEGVIDSKHFNGRQSSRTYRNIEGPDFGTPGDISHSLKFVVGKGGGSFILYLNNWERKLYQRGLVARMRVRVRCAELTNRYLRSNAMTSFSLLGLVDVSDDIKTANLNETNPRIIYGSLANLGLQCNVVMRTRVKVLNTQRCMIEVKPDGSFNFSLSLFVLGPSEALLRSTSKDLLRRLLNCGNNDDDDNLNEWNEMFESCGPITLPDFSKDNCSSGGNICNIVRKSLVWRLKMLNWMDVICSYEIKSTNLPVWDLLQLVEFD
ncbi:PREDICTED: uncharacterized protein LOC108556798 [Nicrophorus vespilloides]|uniref:Uncharacterized protein LOC108556798 n=1 Tax=Nicrophorus vespilloides TaxID=110193 RepID=A0ABM1M1W0_NICVS|nr:PREDICTED: uncharacterized protein LOC108556798 [Nicrophorus vespilloides]